MRPHSFTCDVCGTHGKNISFICSTCNIVIHKDCISWPCFIRINLHRLPISSNFFLTIHRDDSRTWDCKICYKKVNIEHESYCYSWSAWDLIIHVKCATSWLSNTPYNVTGFENLDEFKELDESENLIIRVLRENKVGDNVVVAEIIRSSHDLQSFTFNDDIVGF